MTKRYEEELEADLVTVDDLIALANSDLGKQIFGEKAAQVAAHGEKIKAAGARYCDCPACKAVEAILALSLIHISLRLQPLFLTNLKEKVSVFHLAERFGYCENAAWRHDAAR